MAINYFCSGFDKDNAFWSELAERFKNELDDTKSIIYIPGSPNKVEKAKNKYVPAFTEHFRKIGIEFEEVHLLTPDMDPTLAQQIVEGASFIMLMGGDPYAQKQMCEEKGISPKIKNHSGILLGFSAGAMIMSKHIITVPCSEEYPDFHIEAGFNLSNISIYPHNNFSGEEYPEQVTAGNETTKRNDLIKVAKEYGDFYLLQDNLENGLTNVSLIRTCDDKMEFITNNNGKIWRVTPNGIILEKLNKSFKR